MILKFCYIKNIKKDIFPHCEAEKKYKFLFYYLHDPHRTIYNNWSIKFLEKPITDENYEEIFEMEDPVVKVLKDDKYVII